MYPKVGKTIGNRIEEMGGDFSTNAQEHLDKSFKFFEDPEFRFRMFMTTQVNGFEYQVFNALRNSDPDNIEKINQYPPLVVCSYGKYSIPDSWGFNPFLTKISEKPEGICSIKVDEYEISLPSIGGVFNSFRTLN